MNRDDMLRLFLAGDPAGDAWFRTAVVTTGIYCRASCRARKPRPENVLFFRTAAEARAAGFRACKRCRPDAQQVDDAAEIADRTAAWFEHAAACGDDRTVRAMADAFGTSERHLRRRFRDAALGTPRAFLDDLAMARAVRLLSQDGCSVTDAALQGGYGSLAAFHRAFRRRHRMSPTDFRRRAAGPGVASDAGGSRGAR